MDGSRSSARETSARSVEPTGPPAALRASARSASSSASATPSNPKTLAAEPSACTLRTSIPRRSREPGIVLQLMQRVAQGGQAPPERRDELRAGASQPAFVLGDGSCTAIIVPALSHAGPYARVFGGFVRLPGQTLPNRGPGLVGVSLPPRPGCIFPLRARLRRPASMRVSSSGQPRCASIIPTVSRAAKGFATFLPARAGAEPWTGSNKPTRAGSAG